MKNENNITDLELENLLNLRGFVPASNNLAYRIITKAKNCQIDKENNSNIWDIIKDFLLPKPIFAMAMALLLGLYLGGMLNESDITDSQESYQVSTFLYDSGM